MNTKYLQTRNGLIRLSAVRNIRTAYPSSVWADETLIATPPHHLDPADHRRWVHEFTTELTRRILESDTAVIDSDAVAVDATQRARRAGNHPGGRRFGRNRDDSDSGGSGPPGEPDPPPPTRLKGGEDDD